MKEFKNDALDEMFYGKPKAPAKADPSAPTGTKNDNLRGLLTPVRESDRQPQARKDLLPSVKAFTYKQKLEDIQQLDLAGRKSRDVLAEQVGESPKQLSRYIRLTSLHPVLLQAVDEKKLGLNIGVSLSFLRPENQEIIALFCFMDHSLHISQAMATDLRYMDVDGARFTPEFLEHYFEPKGKNLKNITLPYDAVQRYFPGNVSQKEIDHTIQQALKQYFAEERPEDVNDAQHP